MLIGLEHHVQLCCAGEEFVVVSGQQRARGVARAAGEPVGAQLDQQPLPVHRQGRVGGCVDADQLVTAQLVHLVVEEVDRPAQEYALEAGRAIDPRGHDDVAGRALEHRLGVIEWLPPTPSFDHARVAGFGQRVSAEVGADQESIGICPAVSGLGLRQGEPVRDEFTCRHVEFAEDSRVRAASRQADQGAGALGFDDVGTGPHPVLVVDAGQFI